MKGQTLTSGMLTNLLIVLGNGIGWDIHIPLRSAVAAATKGTVHTRNSTDIELEIRPALWRQLRVYSYSHMQTESPSQSHERSTGETALGKPHWGNRTGETVLGRRISKHQQLLDACCSGALQRSSPPQ
ncbi:uncharacterized protein [Drosophila pseudoobscura]|uniref:Uncharacterized protein n=1 Tax=Drosophila pseudoobscura pseudoobscura TaxID=46245 RepID=A0A6I8VJ46_DROPS|nr:uncharacterized protein LOC6901012 [Drosophila pseudoobscura]